MNIHHLILATLIVIGLSNCSEDNSFNGRTPTANNTVANSGDAAGDPTTFGTGEEAEANAETTASNDAELNDNASSNNDSSNPQDNPGSVTVLTGQVDCNDINQKIEDPNATFVFNYNEDIRAFLNTKCNAQIPTSYRNAGGTRGDAATQLKICQLKGYQSVGTSTTWGYHSPGNNHVTWWDGSKFTTASAAVHNHITGNLVCKGLIKDQCSNSAQTVTCN